MNATLAARAAAAGIEPAFTDYFGKTVAVEDATLEALLEAIGPTPAAPGPLILTQGTSLDALSGARIELETGETFDGEPAALPLGYHRAAGGAGPSRDLIVVPRTCYVPPELERPENSRWALATQLYALRSGRNWGMGDFSDLNAFAQTAGAAGFTAVALNPLHELHPANPAACSPYAPSSRYYLNALYVDVEAVPEFAACDAAQALVRDAAFRSELERLRAAPLVEYPGVARAKRRAFEALYAHFARSRLARPGDARASQFRSFVRAGGARLEALARYEALAERFRAADEHVYGWQQWPPEYRSPESPAVERFARERRERIDFFLYLQWLASEQLDAAAARARALGVGLYRDLAVGVDLNSADAWSDQATVVAGAALGAPPDHLNALGQNWGLPPFSPAALQARNFEPYVRLLRANMRGAAILRIDHVMALRRGFWIPRGRPPAEGAYVRYPMDAMLGILALESTRNRCTIVGEDLGTLPEGFRERLAAAHSLSSRLIYFERGYDSGVFADASAYPRLAAASVGTHDLPPLAGWWTGSDIDLRERIHLFPGDASLREARSERDWARLKLVEALERAGAATPETAARLTEDARAGGTLAVTPELEGCVHRFLAQTPSMLKIVAIEDLLGETEAINVPGTVDEHPNWRRKHLLPIEELLSRSSVARIGEIVREVSRT